MDPRELRPLWLERGEGPGHGAKTLPALNGDVACDVIVVGGGITGLTTAWLLTEAGLQVIVVDAAHVGEGETCRTTAHLTHVPDAWLTHLVDRYGVCTAKTIWDGQKLAVDTVERLCTELGIDCGFTRVPGYLFTDDPRRIDELQRVCQLAHDIGFVCREPTETGLPHEPTFALEFPQQARFDPTRYIAGLTRALADRGVRLYEETRIVDVTSGDDGARAETDAGYEIAGRDIVVAAHVPFNNRLHVHAKQAPYRSYVIAVRVPKGSFPDALFADTANPYHYVRLQPRTYDDLVLVGGEDHKTGQEGDLDGAHRFARLREFARVRFGLTGEVVHAWSGQIIVTADELPYIGLNVGGRNEYIATGYGGDGMSYGTLAAHIISERILGRSTPWDQVYSPSRLELSALKAVYDENKDFPLQILRDFFSSGERRSPDMLQPGEGGIFKAHGRKIAFSRGDNGELVAVSPTCTHLGCGVHWNATERTWDCPCHGSRYAADGEVINGPARRPLERYALTDALEEKPAVAAGMFKVIPGVATEPAAT